MDEDYQVLAEQAVRLATRIGDFDQQIAQQDATIQTIERRLVVAGRPRRHLSLFQHASTVAAFI